MMLVTCGHAALVAIAAKAPSAQASAQASATTAQATNLSNLKVRTMLAS